MMVNEFANRVYTCGSDCQCMFQTHLVGQCSFSGLAVLETYGYKTGKTGEWVGFLLAIVFGLRFLGWVALWGAEVTDCLKFKLASVSLPTNAELMIPWDGG